MEKKIKSVKLKNDYRTEDFVYLKGHIGEIDDYGHCCRFRKKTGEYLYFSKSDIENNKTDLFEIEYEPERKFIDVRIEYDNRVKLYGEDITANSLERFFHDDFVRRNQIKVIELPEVFTREDMIDFAYKCRHLVEPPESRIDKFISERKSNGR